MAEMDVKLVFSLATLLTMGEKFFSFGAQGRKGAQGERGPKGEDVSC